MTSSCVLTQCMCVCVPTLLTTKVSLIVPELLICSLKSLVICSKVGLFFSFLSGSFTKS